MNAPARAESPQTCETLADVPIPVNASAGSLDATLHALLNAPDEDSILVVDRHGTLLALNGVAARRLGQPVDALVGTLLYDHFDAALGNVRRQHSEEVIRTRRPKRYHDRRIGRVFENHVRPVFGAGGEVQRLVIFARDITEQHRAQEEVARLERFYRQILENLPAELAVFDVEGRYLYVNPSAVRDPGTRAWLTGKRDTDYWAWRGVEAPISEARDAAFRQCVETRQVVSMEESIPCRDGTTRHYERRFSAVVGSDGTVTQVIGYGLDLTDRRRAEEEARLRREQLIQADKMVSLGTLVSGVAHEINNPNQYIMSNATMLAKAWAGALPVLDSYYQEQGEFSLGGLPYSAMRERMHGVIQGIRDGSDRIKRIVQELRDFARQEPGEFDDHVDLNAVVASAMALASHNLSSSTTRLSVEYGANLPAVLGHFQRLEQVVVNLLVNACQALHEQDEAIEVSTAYSSEDDLVLVRVRDEGEGMAEGVMNHVMDPFFTTRRKEGGTGLGLSISSAIAREHGGNLMFSSRVGEGTLASLRLPAAPGTQGTKP